MFESLLALVDLTGSEFFWLTLIVLFAGLVRGFSGFALSALIMATAVIFLAPIELLPMLWWLELSASLLMLKEGWADADRGTAYGLVIGSAFGWPIGLWLTVTLPVETSKLVALTVIIALAVSQLSKLKLSFLATKPGLYGAGVVAGIVSGLAHVGGMVVALYVLSSDAPARQMRGSLVLFLFLGSLTSMVTLLAFGVMDFSGITRGLIFAMPTFAGVYLGQKLFVPALAQYYRPFCLSLLCILAATSLVRTVTTS